MDVFYSCNKYQKHGKIRPGSDIMKTAIAIGGGNIKELETQHIDQAIIACTKLNMPNLLVLPTASHDSFAYTKRVKKYFKRFGCNVDVLRLTLDETSDVITAKIKWANIIYIGSGNTCYMMEMWKKYGVDILLKQAYEQGCVLAGISAGAIALFDYGYSDSLGEHTLSMVEGLHLIPAVFTPHYNEAGRERFDEEAMHFDLAYALDNQVALIFQDEQIEVIQDHSLAHAYRFIKGKKEEL